MVQCEQSGTSPYRHTVPISGAVLETTVTNVQPRGGSGILEM